MKKKSQKTKYLKTFALLFKKTYLGPRDKGKIKINENLCVRGWNNKIEEIKSMAAKNSQITKEQECMEKKASQNKEKITDNAEAGDLPSCWKSPDC